MKSMETINNNWNKQTEYGNSDEGTDEEEIITTME